MRILLDTHILIWLMNGDARLNGKARALIEQAESVYASSASIWEMAIKERQGKLRVDVARLAERLAEADIDELPVKNQHAIATGKLPLLHRDPFDRLLVAQAIIEPMRLLTADPQLASYSELVMVV